MTRINRTVELANRWISFAAEHAQDKSLKKLGGPGEDVVLAFRQDHFKSAAAPKNELAKLNADDRVTNRELARASETVQTVFHYASLGYEPGAHAVGVARMPKGRDPYSLAILLGNGHPADENK